LHCGSPQRHGSIVVRIAAPKIAESAVDFMRVAVAVVIYEILPNESARIDATAPIAGFRIAGMFPLVDAKPSERIAASVYLFTHCSNSH
jgi:hypothetical protein